MAHAAVLCDARQDLRGIQSPAFMIISVGAGFIGPPGRAMASNGSKSHHGCRAVPVARVAYGQRRRRQSALPLRQTVKEQRHARAEQPHILGEAEALLGRPDAARLPHAGRLEIQLNQPGGESSQCGSNQS